MYRMVHEMPFWGFLTFLGIGDILMLNHHEENDLKQLLRNGQGSQ